MAKLVCSSCGTVGSPVQKQRGSYLLLLFLLLCFIVPGVFYFMWMLGATIKVCRKCGSSSLVPVDSPMGRKLSRA